MSASAQPLVALEVGTHRLLLHTMELGETLTGCSMAVARFRVLRSAAHAAGHALSLRFTLHRAERVDEETGETRAMLSRLGEWEASRAKTLIVSAIRGVKNPPEHWKFRDENEIVESSIEALAPRRRAQQHIVDVDVTKEPTKGARPLLYTRYAWRPVSHYLATDSGHALEALPTLA